MSAYFLPADILLPDFDKVDGKAWSVVACDQYTSEPEYWASVEEQVGEKPSTLRLILPEVYLSETENRVSGIYANMEDYLKNVLVRHQNKMVYLERTQSNGLVRRGLIGMIDLEHYDYNKGSQSLIRATEGTVLDRIPPRLKVRRDAALELPHVMLLIDDPGKTVIEPLAARAETLPLAYSYSLMEKGGKVTGRFVDSVGIGRIAAALNRLIAPEQVKARYGEGIAPLLFAVGDGNHSLATAKAAYEEIKAKHGAAAALYHPARYALVEVVNLHDPALHFEPIYRVMFNVEPDDVLAELEQYSFELHGNAAPQQARFLSAERRGTIHFGAPAEQLVVGTLQTFIDRYLAKHPEASVDYIHGTKSVEALATREKAVGFLFSGMEKGQLFGAVMHDGALPRKTFSMGAAADKRYYTECRRIK
ncbi:MAG: DUF1015 domain-containing protein [Ruminococcaceae bacterium]|nr:DUF1015 domain-containing protein [Oscillospiraceae bacterium]